MIGRGMSNKKRALLDSANALFLSLEIIFYGFTIVFPAMVIAPVLAGALRSSVAPVLNVFDCMAMTVPLKNEVDPNVAELPTCQKILDASAPHSGLLCVRKWW